MIRLLEDNTVIASDGSVVNSGHPDKTSCAKSRAIAEAFPYRHDILYSRADSENVEEMAFDGKVIYIRRHVCDASGEGIRETNRHGYKDLVLDPLEDRDAFSGRVKAFAGIVFDAQARSSFIASLPRQDVRVMENGKVKTMVVDKENTETMLINGVPQKVVSRESRLVDVTKTLISYKGKSYLEDEL